MHPFGRHSCATKFVTPSAIELYGDQTLFREQMKWDGQTFTSKLLNDNRRNLIAHVDVMEDALTALAANDTEVTIGFHPLGIFATKVFEHHSTATGAEVETCQRAEGRWGFSSKELGLMPRTKLATMAAKLSHSLDAMKDISAGRIRNVGRVNIPPESEQSEIDAMHGRSPPPYDFVNEARVSESRSAYGSNSPFDPRTPNSERSPRRVRLNRNLVAANIMAFATS